MLSRRRQGFVSDSWAFLFVHVKLFYRIVSYRIEIRNSETITRTLRACDVGELVCTSTSTMDLARVKCGLMN